MDAKIRKISQSELTASSTEQIRKAKRVGFNKEEKRKQNKKKKEMQKPNNAKRMHIVAILGLSVHQTRCDITLEESRRRTMED